MNLREVVPQVLEALRQSRVCLEDGPTALVLSHKGKRVQVRVTQAGDCIKLSTGRVWKRAVKLPVSALGETGPTSRGKGR